MKVVQNIYDDPVFFEGYRKLRGNPDSANALQEKPALFALSPDLGGKSVLDLGCGYGENCATFYRMGAKKVVGIDISKKMIQAAKFENPNIHFIIMDMNNLSFSGQKFDVVFSSLAVHYIEDFDNFVRSVFNLIGNDGYFVFSQEHPLTTSPIGGASWAINEEGDAIHYKLTDYARSGERKTRWIVDGVVKYHRTFSELINTVICNGFVVEKVLEPIPGNEIIERLPSYGKDMHKPNFLLVRARKQAECRGRKI